MGNRVGSCVGRVVGIRDGRGVGWRVGNGVGGVVGLIVGFSVTLAFDSVDVSRVKLRSIQSHQITHFASPEQRMPSHLHRHMTLQDKNLLPHCIESQLERPVNSRCPKCTATIENWRMQQKA